MSKFKVIATNQFKKDLKLAKKRGMDFNEFYHVVNQLANGEKLSSQLQNHLLHGDYKGYWECHINPDWLLIYSKDNEIRIISLSRTGTHSDLFEKGKKK